MYACRTFWLSCFFIKDIDNATYTGGIAFQRGKRPAVSYTQLADNPRVHDALVKEQEQEPEVAADRYRQQNK